MKLYTHYVNKYIYLIIITFLFLIYSCGLAGSRSYITAPSVNYPVSLSPAIRNVDGTISMEDDLVKVGEFYYQYKSGSMLWLAIPLTETKYDISNALNEQIGKVGGEAIINLSIKNNGDPLVILSPALSFGLLPSYSSIEITGDVVSRKVIPK